MNRSILYRGLLGGAALTLGLSALLWAADAYDPLAKAYASLGQAVNLEASVPPQCYTKTAGTSNPCWTCHTVPRDPNFHLDADLQEEYSFSGFALRNRWDNLFKDRSAAIARIGDGEVLEYIRTDNYTPLRQALAARPDFPGYRADLDLARGFDEEGFARDGSGWRALRYKPFPGTFWPTNGSTDDVMIRLPKAFRTADGAESREVYKANLAILEAAIAGDPFQKDLRLPERYLGDAREVAVHRYLYPQGTEFLHTVRYVDPDRPELLSARLKELRYSRKVQWLDTWALLRSQEREVDDKDEGLVPIYSGDARVGLLTDYGWQLQGFIEDEQGRLRLQTDEEHRSCMGCHGSLSVTVDGTFTLPRKVPGAEGWRHQDLRGIPDAPQAGHSQPEILTYFERVQGGDELRANAEVLERFFPGGRLDRAQVLRAAKGGDRDIAFLLTPSRERAILLNKAYMTLVREQSFDLGRDALPAPPANVHRQIENGSTDLGRTGRVYRDGRLWLDW